MPEIYSNCGGSVSIIFNLSTVWHLHLSTPFEPQPRKDRLHHGLPHLEYNPSPVLAPAASPVPSFAAVVPAVVCAVQETVQNAKDKITNKEIIIKILFVHLNWQRNIKIFGETRLGYIGTTFNPIEDNTKNKLKKCVWKTIMMLYPRI